jgi:xanthine dehydrogenase YagR molybdenum-binding subunit
VSGPLGSPLDRLDGWLKVSGGARYTAEWPLDRIAYGALVTSTIAKGSIVRADVAAARALPGVLAVLTHENAPKLPQGGRLAMNPPAGRELSLLQTAAVRYNGEPIGVAVADSFEAATDAANRVVIEYAEERPMVDMEAGVATAEPYTRKILGRLEPTYRHGDVAAALAAADARVEQVYRTPIETHNAMETHGTIAFWEGDKLTLYDSTQYLYGVKRFVAKTLGLPEDAVHVISKFVGGAFGSKGSAWSHVVLAAMAARVVGRPVKLVLTRRQMFGPVGARPYTVQRTALAGRKDGTLTALRQDVTSSTSTFEDWVEASSLQARLLYASPNLETAQALVRLNVGTPTFNRAPGESSGTFALESAMDELADGLGVDPIELRLRNLAQKDAESGLPFSSNALDRCLRDGAQRFGWERRGRPGATLQGDVLVGMGVATATYPARRAPASARASVEEDGGVRVLAATHELGTGTITILSQIAADALGVPIARVRLELGDSAYPENPISAGSLTAASSGSAVLATAKALREKLRAAGVDPADAEACRRRARSGRVEVEEHAAPGEETQRYAMHSFGAVFAEVRVDRALGEVRVARLLGAYGAGRILNPKTARSQLIGGIVYGLGMALFEHTSIDPRSGRYVNADLAEYHIPCHADVPDIDVLFVDENDPQVNPLGAKGIGEIGTTGVAAAVANAVYNACGVRVRSLPIRVEDVLAGLGAKT